MPIDSDRQLEGAAGVVEIFGERGQVVGRASNLLGACGGLLRHLRNLAHRFREAFRATRLLAGVERDDSMRSASRAETLSISPRAYNG